MKHTTLIPEETLRGFFAAMHEWGTEMIRHYESIEWGKTSQAELDKAKTAQRARLVEVFEAYCEVGSKAERLQDQGLAFDLDEPEYNPDHKIVSKDTTGDRALIVVEGRDFLFRYELVRKDDRWWIRDNKKRSSKKNEKWKPDIL